MFLDLNLDFFFTMVGQTECTFELFYSNNSKKNVKNYVGNSVIQITERKI